MRRNTMNRIKNVSRLALPVLIAVQLAGCDSFGKSDAEYLQRAQQAVAKNELKSAVIDLKTAIQKNSANAQARLLLGQIYLRLGNGADAEKELRQAEAAGATGAQTYLPLLYAYLYQGEYKKLLAARPQPGADAGTVATWNALAAQAEIFGGNRAQAQTYTEKSQELQPDLPENLLSRSFISRSDGDLDSAVQLLRQATAADPAFVRAWLALGDAYGAQGNFPEAVSAYGKVLGNEQPGMLSRFEYQASLARIRANLSSAQYDAARKDIERLNQQKLESPDVWHFEALLAFRDNQYEKAGDILMKVMAKFPDHQPSMLLLGVVRHEQKQYEQADMYLSKFLAVAPDHVPARKLLASARMNMNMPDKAYAALEPALGSASKDDQLMALLGGVALRKGDFKQGREILQKLLEKNPDAASLKTELAMAFLAQGRPEDAVRELQGIAEGTGGTAQADQLLVIAYLQQKQLAKALDAAKNLARKHPQEAGAHLVLAGVHQLDRQWGEARKALDAALKLQPDNEQALLRLSQVDYADGKIDDAYTRLQAIVKKNPRAVPAYMGLAQIDSQKGRDKEAVQWLEQAANADEAAPMPRMVLARYHLRQKDHFAAQKVVSQLLAKNPGSQEAMLLDAQVSLAKGDVDVAQQKLETLARKHPNANTFYSLALVQQHLNKTAQAQASARKALEHNKDFLPASILLARIALQEKQYPQAAAHADEIIARSPDQALGYDLKGDVYVAQGDLRAAEKQYAAAVQKQAVSSVIVKLSQARRQLGDGKAHLILEERLKAQPDDAVVGTELAISYQTLGRTGDAMRQYQSVLQKNQDNLIALNNLAWLKSEEGDLAGAQQFAEQAYAIDKNNADVLDTYAWILSKKGDNHRAELLLKTAVENNGNPEIKYHYAVVLSNLGKRDESRALLDGILKPGVNFPSLAQARELHGRL